MARLCNQCGSAHKPQVDCPFPRCPVTMRLTLRRSRDADFFSAVLLVLFLLATIGLMLVQGDFDLVFAAVLS